MPFIVRGGRIVAEVEPAGRYVILFYEDGEHVTAWLKEPSKENAMEAAMVLLSEQA